MPRGRFDGAIEALVGGAPRCNALSRSEELERRLLRTSTTAVVGLICRAPARRRTGGTGRRGG